MKYQRHYVITKDGITFADREVRTKEEAEKKYGRRAIITPIRFNNKGLKTKSA